jgi:hypothetical protein
MGSENFDIDITCFPWLQRRHRLWESRGNKIKKSEENVRSPCFSTLHNHNSLSISPHHPLFNSLLYASESQLKTALSISISIKPLPRVSRLNIASAQTQAQQHNDTAAEEQTEEQKKRGE